MRRVTLAILALGCLALTVGVVLGPNGAAPISVTVSAQSALHPCTGGCSLEPGKKDQADHYAFCHFRQPGAIVLCPDSSSIAMHLANHTDHDGDDLPPDFCIDTIEDLLACQKGEQPPK